MDTSHMIIIIIIEVLPVPQDPRNMPNQGVKYIIIDIFTIFWQVRCYNFLMLYLHTSRYFRCAKLQEYIKPGGKVFHFSNSLTVVLHQTLVLILDILERTHQVDIQSMIEMFRYILSTSSPPII